jgi:hypothetical protein
MMKKKGLIILMSFALVLLLSAPGWAAFTTDCIPGLEIGGYIRNQTDIRAASPQDIMRFSNSLDIHADYKPSPHFQFYLELRPFVDSAYDLSSGLTRHNREVMHIESSDYAWRSSTPTAIGIFGTNAIVQGHVSDHDVLSTNMNTDYWLRNSFLREAWGLYQDECMQVKIGKQIVTWGETDGLKLLDFINATDYSHFIIDSMEDSKIPEWMMNITYYLTKDYNLQFLWIPWYVQNFQAPAGSAWALDGVNLIYYFDHFDALNIANLGFPGAATVARYACTVNYHNPTNQNEFAGRFKGTIGTNTDFTLNFFYTHDKNNVFINTYNNTKSPFPSNLDVFQFRTNPEIQRIYGGSFNHVIGNVFGLMHDLVMRGEVAYYYKTDFFGTYKNFNYFNGIGPAQFGLSPGGDLFITRKNLLRGCIGWDKNAFFLGHAWLLSLQTFWEHIFAYTDHSQITDPGLSAGQLASGLPQSATFGRHYKEYISNVGLTKAHQDEVTFTFFMNTDFMNQRIKPEDLIVFNAMQRDLWNRFKVTFDISDHWSFAVGNNWFFGRDGANEINPFVGNAPWYAGAPISGPLNPDATTIGNIQRGSPLGEMSRNTSFFMDLKYLF